MVIYGINLNANIPAIGIRTNNISSIAYATEETASLAIIGRPQSFDNFWCEISLFFNGFPKSNFFIVFII